MQLYCHDLNYTREDLDIVFLKAGWKVSQSSSQMVFTKKEKGYDNRIVFEDYRKDTLDVIEVSESELGRIQSILLDAGYATEVIS